MKRLPAVVIAISFCFTVTMVMMTVQAASTAYYVDSATGNDSNDGTRPSKAWKTLAKVNATTFQPGDRILFRAGGSWTGTLHPLGSGDSSSQITIDMYGSGSKPIIAGNGAVAAIVLDGQEYWTVSNLHATNHSATTALRQGIYVYGKASGITHKIRVANCEVSDVTGQNDRSRPPYQNIYWNSAIYISMPGRSTSESHLDDILVEGNHIHDVTCSGIRVTQQRDFVIDIYHTNVVIRNNTIRNTGTDGIIISNSVSPLIEHNAGFDLGINGITATRVIAGMWSASASDPVYQYNEVARTRLFAGDGTAFDSDWGTRGTAIFQYNYTHQNQGGFLLDCEELKPDPGFVKNIVRYNVSVDDDQFLVRHGSNATEIYNNVFYKSGGVLADSSKVAGKHLYWNNIFYFPTAPDWGAATYDYNCYYPIQKNPSDVHGVTGDPGFAGPGIMGDGMKYADNYKIGPGSPCLDKGMAIPGNGGRDFWGNPLYSGAADIGAHEYRAIPAGGAGGRKR